MKKILLLHGWNWKNYSKLTDSKDAWDNRKELVKLLSKKYEIYKINFPGFCGEKEPKKSWNLTDYATLINNYLKSNKLKVDYILGYSFGGAVALKYYSLFDNNQKLILISPAITRNKNNSKDFIKTPKILDPIRNVLRNIYLKYIIKNPYMINGTKFLNNSYQNIVREELLNELNQVNPNNIQIIYGKDDDMVNPNYILTKTNNNLKKCIKVIDGDHDIANNNPLEIIKIIDDYIKKN